MRIDDTVPLNTRTDKRFLEMRDWKAAGSGWLWKFTWLVTVLNSFSSFGQSRSHWKRYFSKERKHVLTLVLNSATGIVEVTVTALSSSLLITSRHWASSSTPFPFISMRHSEQKRHGTSPYCMFLLRFLYCSLCFLPSRSFWRIWKRERWLGKWGMCWEWTNAIRKFVVCVVAKDFSETRTQSVRIETATAW